jgi:hypothetical protein
MQLVNVEVTNMSGYGMDARLVCLRCRSVTYGRGRHVSKKNGRKSGERDILQLSRRGLASI